MIARKPPRFRLDGKRALVVGASRGIDLAAAPAPAQADASVVLAVCVEAKLCAARESVQESGGSARQRVGDIRDADAMCNGMERHESFRDLVNNAGTNLPKLAVGVTDDDLDALIDRNFRSAFAVARDAARLLLATGQPSSCIKVSSQMGHVGSPRRSVYGATKHAVEDMTNALAYEFGPYGIRVNTVRPIFVDTDITRALYEDALFSESVLRQVAPDRLATLQYPKGPIVFLASDASAVATGQPPCARPSRTRIRWRRSRQAVSRGTSTSAGPPCRPSP